MSEYCHVTLRVTLVIIIFVSVSVYLIVACNIPGASPGSPAGNKSACNAGGPSLIPSSGRYAEEGIGYPPQYSWTPLMVQIVKNPRPGLDPWVGKIPWRREQLPTPAHNLCSHHKCK